MPFSVVSPVRSFAVAVALLFGCARLALARPLAFDDPTFRPPVHEKVKRQDADGDSDDYSGFMPDADVDVWFDWPGLSIKTSDSGPPSDGYSTTDCTSVPKSFSGTDAGFEAAADGTRYCLPPTVNEAMWAGTSGEVTRGEIEAMLGLFQNISAVTSIGTGNGNILSDGTFGQAAYAASLMFEVTGDLRFLDQMVRMADNILALRNDPKTGRVMWDGKREPVWPTSTGDQAGYAGCEGMQVVAHMVNAAIAIIKTPAIGGFTMGQTIPSDGPTMFSSTTTYMQRALAYIEAADETVTQYYLPWFLDSSDLIIQPNDTRWNGIDSQPPGQWMPYNRRMFMLHGFSKLAVAHDLPATANQTLSARLRDVTTTNTNQFVENLQLLKTSNGLDAWNWTYGPDPDAGGNRTEEAVVGIHGMYDMWGMFLMWQSGLFSDESVMTSLGNGPQHLWNFGNDSFASFVDGTTSPDFPPQARLAGQFAFYERFVPGLFKTVSGADEEIAYLSNPAYAGPLLWTKHAVALQNDGFWRGRFSTPDPVVLVGTSGASRLTILWGFFLPLVVGVFVVCF